MAWRESPRPPKCGGLAMTAKDIFGYQRLMKNDKEGETMYVARFIADDPFNPPATEDEIDDALSKMDGVADWTIHASDEVTVEYHAAQINDQQIEEALSGMGFRVTHISDLPERPEVPK
jgi:copper chaperone CopZ